jgi:sec-independent protein translocase protein TatB
MLSPSDTAIVFLVALLLFGPEQLPKIARQLGVAMHKMQATTHSFMLEMERAAAGDESRDAGDVLADKNPPQDLR